MGTRSNITRENADGSFDSIYCHWDGYPSHNGRILLEHYTDAEKINELLSLGDLSSLGASIGQKHDFNDRENSDCTFYGRDRGESGTETQHFEDAEELAGYLEESWTEWVYLYRVAEGRWYFTNNPSPTWFKCCGSKQRATELLTMEACA